MKKKLIKSLTKKAFIDFYNACADEVGNKKEDWDILDHIFNDLVENERKMIKRGYRE